MNFTHFQDCSQILYRLFSQQFSKNSFRILPPVTEVVDQLYRKSPLIKSGHKVSLSYKH